MDQPRTPVERLQLFKPRFCPWPDCLEHRRTCRRYRFRRWGVYTTPNGRTVPRFRCHACRRTFSRQTFSVTYYLKRPGLVPHVAAQLQAGSAQRQIGRTLGCAASTVTRLSQRLGRHALLLHGRARRLLVGRLSEPIVLDHAETFEYSQDLPFGIATPIGAHSWYCYEIDPAPHERTGRRSVFQQARWLTRARRAPRPSFGGIHGSSQRVVDRLLMLVRPGQALELRSDGHRAYVDVVTTHPERARIRHQRFPNPRRGPKRAPRSQKARARDRAMFPVDAWHALIRHTLAHHRRETIAFGRRLNALIERLYLTVVWRNFIKGRSERKPDPSTPAMTLKLASEPWDWRRVFSRRLFPTREHPTAIETILYRRQWLTPLLPANRQHCLRHAY